MQKKLLRFYSDDSGAVTVDWVVLTGAVVGLGILVLTPIAFSAGNSASVIGSSVGGAQVGYQSP